MTKEIYRPLSVIMPEAKGLRDGLQSADSASEHIIQEVDRLRGLVTDLDWLAETDHGELTLNLEKCSVHDLLAVEVDRWQPQSRARQVELSLEVHGDLPDMNLDRMRMSQALGNVVSNAIHCTEPGGSVVIRAWPEGDELTVSITDDGMGIEETDLPHVFDRFYRTDESRSRGIGGTGLGLAITRAIVEAHGGTTTVASDGLGQGVTVTVRLML
ncbi:MAG: cell wall metabolism sensor histidine kinase WalK [Acidimicrobiaceae bacterium]|nr:cell wall metabolism sensor histidine kinase WalK [Acidimicrobiaceae bacterium]